MIGVRERGRGHGRPRNEVEEHVGEMAAEPPQRRGVRALRHAMRLLELVDERADLLRTPRRPLDEAATEIKDQRLVVDQTGHGAPPYAGFAMRSVYRIAGKPVAESIWLPIRSNEEIFRTRSNRPVCSRLVIDSLKSNPPISVLSRQPSSW